MPVIGLCPDRAVQVDIGTWEGGLVMLVEGALHSCQYCAELLTIRRQAIARRLLNGKLL